LYFISIEAPAFYVLMQLLREQHENLSHQKHFFQFKMH